jgi:nitric oxide reductase NorD protein
MGPRPAPDDLGRFGLLASAIAGRPVDVASADPHERSWTDGTTVFVDAQAERRERLCALAVQASLLSAESLEPSVLASLARRPKVVARYLALEGHRALASVESILPQSVRGLVDHELAERTDSPTRSLEVAVSREPMDDPPDAFGTIRPRRVRHSAGQHPGASVTTEHAPRSSPPGGMRELDDEEDDRLVVDFLSSPVGGGGGIGRLLKKLFGDARTAGGGQPGADAPTHATRRGAQKGGLGAISSAAAPMTVSSEPAAARGTVYPEWDVHRRRYRSDWCTVREVDPPEGAAGGWTPPDSRSLRRALSRLGMAMERRDRQMQGIDIDIDAAIDARLQAMAGTAPEEGVYVDLVRRRRDLAVLLLLDVSGSAGEPSPVGGTVHDHQRAAAGALAMALHDLGDRVALYAFRSQGRSAVQVAPVKRFGDPLDARVLLRLGGCEPGAYTRLGAAIRHGAAVLERDGGTSRRLLVVLSDGFAYDHGYEGDYGEADARRALVEARRRGTGCLCLSLGGTTEAEALRRVFGTAAHASVPKVEQLPGLVGPLFRFAFLSAEVQRHAFQHKARTRERLDMERLTA